MVEDAESQGKKKMLRKRTGMERQVIVGDGMCEVGECMCEGGAETALEVGIVSKRAWIGLLNRHVEMFSKGAN